MPPTRWGEKPFVSYSAPLRSFIMGHRFIHSFILSLDGKELMLIILATILTITTPTGTLSPDASLIYLGMFRILLGVGVGGDYPMSASVTSDRANIRKRGTMLAYIFANQGWGSFAGSLVTIIVLLCYKSAMEVHGETSKVDGGASPSAFWGPGL